MKAKSYIFILGIAVLLCGLTIISIVIHQIKIRREDYFVSLWYCVYSAENEFSEEFGAHKPLNFSELLSQYADKQLEKSFEDEFIEIHPFLRAPKIKYVPNVGLWETRDYPVSIFERDRLKIFSHENKIQWIRSGEVVDLIRNPKSD